MGAAQVDTVAYDKKEIGHGSFWRSQVALHHFGEKIGARVGTKKKPRPTSASSTAAVCGPASERRKI